MELKARIEGLQAKRNELYAEAEAILAVAKEADRDLTADESARLVAIQGKSESDLGELGAVDAQLKQWQHVATRMEITRAQASAPTPRLGDPPATVVNVKKYRGKAKNFESHQDAVDAGLFCAAAIYGHGPSMDYCRDKGLIVNAHSVGDNTKGGYVVPEPLEASIIRLVETFGNFRRFAFNYPMGSSSVLVPRRAGGFTANFIGEGNEVSESDMAFDQVKLEAKKLGVLTRVSSELDEDAIVALADLISLEIGLSFASKEDQCGFNGDGTSTFGGIVGLKNALNAGSIATAASATTYATLTIDDYLAAIAKLADFEGMSPAWYVSKQCWAVSMSKLQFAGGGNTTDNIAGAAQESFLGYPVRMVNVLPKALTTLTGQMFGYFGDLSMSSTFGSRRGVTLASDSSRYFEYDQIGIRGTERFDINVHERGTATESGPMVAIELQ
jgi:HK97 family phage major capsid protein